MLLYEPRLSSRIIHRKNKMTHLTILILSPILLNRVCSSSEKSHKARGCESDVTDPHTATTLSKSGGTHRSRSLDIFLGETSSYLGFCEGKTCGL